MRNELASSTTPQAQDSGRPFADHAEAVAEWVATERYRHGALFSKLGFDEAAFGTDPFERGIEVLDANVDVHRSPLPLVAAPIAPAREFLVPACSR
jgi:hypothetical protein